MKSSSYGGTKLGDRAGFFSQLNRSLVNSGATTGKYSPIGTDALINVNMHVSLTAVLDATAVLAASFFNHNAPCLSQRCLVCLVKAL